MHPFSSISVVATSWPTYGAIGRDHLQVSLSVDISLRRTCNILLKFRRRGTSVSMHRCMVTLTIIINIAIWLERTSLVGGLCFSGNYPAEYGNAAMLTSEPSVIRAPIKKDPAAPRCRRYKGYSLVERNDS